MLRIYFDRKEIKQVYPCEVSLKTVDVQLRLLGVDKGIDGEQILSKDGDRYE